MPARSTGSTARAFALLVAATAGLALARGVHAGGNIQLRDRAGAIVSTHWDARRLPIRWMLSRDGIPGSGIDDTTLQAEVQAAFDAWDAVPTADVGFTFGGVVDARDGGLDGRFAPGVDGRNLVTFTDPDFVFPTGVLAITLTTGFTRDTVVTAANADLDGDGTADLPTGTYPPGAIFDSDIVFNSSLGWSVDGAPGTIDVRAVALHEVGHLLGLCHSSIRHAVMWPFLAADVASVRTPAADDVAWVSALYPKEPARSTTFGSIAGRITNGANGLPVLGAHVYAVDPVTQASVVGGFSASDGRYVLPGLVPGAYLVAIEPLDGDPPGLEPFRINEVVAGTLDTSFPDEFRDAGEGAVETDPTAALAVPVTAGATAGDVDLVTNTLTLPGASRRLVEGFNLFAWPVAVPTDTTAFDLLAALGGPGEVASVDRYVPATGAFERAEHVDGVASGTDFPVRRGEGYAVHMVRERIASFTGGTDCPALDLAPGLNLIGVPCRPPGYTAFALLADLGSPLEVERVARWDTDAATYRIARYGTGGAPEGDDFAIDPGEGFAVVMRLRKGGVVLPRPGREVTPVLSGLSPGRGVPGTVVALLGEGFDPEPAKNLVTFNGVPAAVIVATTTTVTASVPGAATSGPVRVTVGGRASNTLDFVVEPAVVTPPADGSATDLVSGQTADAALAGDGEQDRYTFTALAGSVVTITATAIAGSVPDLLLVLEDPFGAMVASDDNGGGGTNPRINNFTLATTGTHTIVVASVPGSGTGAYRVGLTIATRPADTQLSILGGDNQSAEAGAVLDEPLTVFATGPTGAPLAGMPVTFVTNEVGFTGQALPGLIEGATVVISTNASGIVSISTALPDKNGIFEIQVAIPGAKPVAFKVAATSARIRTATMRGNLQHGRVGLPLSAPLEIALTDGGGAPVAGALVAFRVVAGGGSLAPGAGCAASGSCTSTATGSASMIFTLGTRVSAPQIVAAFVPGRAKPLLFEAVPEPGPPAKVESNLSNFRRLTIGVNVLNALWTRVLDQYGNPVPGVELSYDPPPGVTVNPGIGPNGVLFPDFKTDADGLHVAAVGVPFVGNQGTSEILPSIDEFGNARVPGLGPYGMTARVAGAPLQVLHFFDVDMGPRLVSPAVEAITGPMGTAAARPLELQLIRYERVERNLDGDFRTDDFAQLQQEVVPGAAVHLESFRDDGGVEEGVGLRPTRPSFSDAVTDAAGIVRFDVTLGDVPGPGSLVGIVRGVHVVFTRAKSVSADFANPSSLTVSSPTRVDGPQLVVDLEDHGTGIDIETVAASLNGTPFFNGAQLPGFLPTFPDRLEILVGGRPLELASELAGRRAFERVTLNFFPSLGLVKAGKNVLEVTPFADQAGNVDPNPSTSRFDWP